MIEVIASSLIVAIVIGTGGSLFYLSFAKIWMERSARESAVCLVSDKSPARCRERLEATLKTGLFFGQIQIERFGANRKASEVRLNLSLGKPLGKSLEKFQIRAASSMPWSLSQINSVSKKQE